MSLTAVTSLTLTTLPSAMAANTVATLGANRQIIDVQAAGATTVLLHRWSPEYLRWVPSAAGAATIAGTAVTETRWDIAGVQAQYCLLTTGTVAATWQPVDAL